MAEIRTVTTLRYKRAEILRTIIMYEEKLDQARADLAHITAALTIFEGAQEGISPRAYVDPLRIFKRRELVALAKEALAKNGPMDTREIAAACITAKGLDAGDRVLVKAITYKLIHALRLHANLGRLVALGKRGAARVWGLPGCTDGVLPLPPT